MALNILIVNAGSSSLKLRLLDDSDRPIASTDLNRWDAGGIEVVSDFVAGLPRVDAVGHRVVHGGGQFPSSVVVDDTVREEIAALSELAPLHQPRSLAGIDAARAVLPRLAHVACFDTTFHAGLPAPAATYALPAEWRKRWGLRRYGFHGLSHAFAARRAAQLLDRDPGALRVVSAHLGAGASLCAVRDGHSADTTMGFTPLEGLVMATRSGSVDPGLLLWLLAGGRLDLDSLTDGLEHHSGLAGLTEGESDMRQVRRSARDGDKLARLALDVFLHRLRAGIAAMAAAMNGLDTLVFTGGVGENDADLRTEAADGLSFLGVELDQDRNASCRADGVISSPRSQVPVLIVESREDVEIADQTRRTLGALSTK